MLARFLGAVADIIHGGEQQPETTKVRCRNSIQRRRGSSSGSSGSVRVMKARSSEMAEIATIEPISFIFRPEKSRVPIQLGRSSAFSVLILETKFS